jgi:hypothetical protein
LQRKERIRSDPGNDVRKIPQLLWCLFKLIGPHPRVLLHAEEFVPAVTEIDEPKITIGEGRSQKPLGRSDWCNFADPADSRQIFPLKICLASFLLHQIADALRVLDACRTMSLQCSFPTFFCA